MADAPAGGHSGFTAIEDSGGALTVKALVDDQVQMVNIYGADPNIATNDLVTLEDPEGLFLASNVVPLVSSSVADEIADVINRVSAALTPEGLVALNVENTDNQRSPQDVAAEWLEANGLN